MIGKWILIFGVLLVVVGAVVWLIGGIRMVKELVFDAYGTLFDVRSVKGRCEETFPDHGPALTAMWRTKQLEYTWLRSLMGRYEDFWRVTEDSLVFACRSLGLDPSQEKIDHLMRAYLELDPFPDAPAALDALGGLSCSILSNGTARMLDAVVRKAGLEDRFQHVLSVDELRTYKPSPMVYRLAEDRLGLPREQIGFVSSNGWDVAGAKAFGFQAYWLNRNNMPAEVLGVEPDRIVRSAMELTTVVA
ncbi:MAG: haloacid dehalogenase type II [Thermoguttaceae bacterium]